MTTLSEAIARLERQAPNYRKRTAMWQIIRQQQRMIEAARGTLDILYTQSCACITNNYSAWEDTLRETRDRSKETLRVLSPDQPLEDL